MDIRRIMLISVTWLLMALLVACAIAGPDSPSPQDTALLNTEWVLVSLNGGSLIESRAITLRFEEATLEGSGGCNTYGGNYTASEDSLSLSGVFATEMACMEPEGILDQEQAYFQALNAVTRYRVCSDRLELYDEGRAQVLAFVSADDRSVPQTMATPVPQKPTLIAAIETPESLPTGG